MKTAAELVFLADEEGSLAPIAEEPALSVASDKRDIAPSSGFSAERKYY
jgi:hypothetical protein